jgi:hypothetical protein
MSKVVSEYWQTRKEYHYYRKVIEFAKEYAPNARTAIDVGPLDTPFLELIDWVPSKTAIDLECLPALDGATNLQGDFMQFEPERPFDVVFCLQVLEHLKAPKPFAQKLLGMGKIVIITVPYKWPKWWCKYHLQDPVNNAKLLRWTKKGWLKRVVVEDEGSKRLITVFEGNV